jgi:hypothetical protein
MTAPARHDDPVRRGFAGRHAVVTTPGAVLALNSDVHVLEDGQSRTIIIGEEVGFGWTQRLRGLLSKAQYQDLSHSQRCVSVRSAIGLRHQVGDG